MHADILAFIYYITLCRHDDTAFSVMQPFTARHINAFRKSILLQLIKACIHACFLSLENQRKHLKRNP